MNYSHDRQKQRLEKVSLLLEVPFSYENILSQSIQRPRFRWYRPRCVTRPRRKV